MSKVILQIPRTNWDAYFMLLAHLTATRSTCDRGPNLLLDPGRHGVGAVLVLDKRVIATGYAGSPPGEPHCDHHGHLMVNGSCVRTIHAEENALIQCAIDGRSPVGATMYTTAGTCFDCAKRVIRAGIARVVYAERYSSRYGLSDAALDMLRRAKVALDQMDVRNEIPYDIQRVVGDAEEE